MTEEQATQLIRENNELRAELKQQKAIISELLKRLYGSKSKQIDADQLMPLLSEDGAKRLETARHSGQEPEVEPETYEPRAKRTSKLCESLRGLPSIERVVIAPEVVVNPGAYRLIGEEVSERLHVCPQSFTRETMRRQTHVKRGDLMCSWHNHMAGMLLPLRERIKGRLRSANYLKAGKHRCAALPGPRQDHPGLPLVLSPPRGWCAF